MIFDFFADIFYFVADIFLLFFNTLLEPFEQIILDVLGNGAGLIVEVMNRFPAGILNEILFTFEMFVIILGYFTWKLALELLWFFAWLGASIPVFGIPSFVRGSK